MSPISICNTIISFVIIIDAYLYLVINLTIIVLTDAAIGDCLYRERAAGYYATYPFALAQFLIEIPYVLAQSVFFSVITYFMVYFYIDAGKLHAMQAIHTLTNQMCVRPFTHLLV